MAKLNATEIYRYARMAGFTPDQAVVMTAIALAESGGNTGAINRNQKELSVGLWQVNTKAHGQKYGNLYDPLANARAAYAISGSGTNIAPWTVTRSGKARNYAAYREFAEAAARNNGDQLSGTAYWGGTSGYGDRKAAAYGARDEVPKNRNLRPDGTPYTAQEMYAIAAVIEQGGGGGSTGGASGVGGVLPAATLPPNATPDQIKQFIIANYGEDMAGFTNIPELWDTLVKAVREGVTDPALLATRIKATDWWSSRSDSMRQWDILLVTDPAQAQARRKAQAEVLKATLDQTGADLDLGSFAELTLRLGYNEDQIREHVSGALLEESAKTGLDQGTIADLTADQLMAMARNEYFVPISRQDAEKWAIQIFRGTFSEDEMRDYLGRMARSRFGDIVSQGMTPGEYMAPIRNIIAETLELNPADVDLLDRRWAQVLAFEGSDGKLRPMSLAEAEQFARSRPEFAHTKTAKADAASMVETLGQTFGAV